MGHARVVRLDRRRTRSPVDHLLFPPSESCRGILATATRRDALAARRHSPPTCGSRLRIRARTRRPGDGGPLRGCARAGRRRVVRPRPRQPIQTGRARRSMPTLRTPSKRPAASSWPGEFVASNRRLSAERGWPMRFRRPSGDHAGARTEQPTFRGDRWHARMTGVARHAPPTFHTSRLRRGRPAGQPALPAASGNTDS